MSFGSGARKLLLGAALAALAGAVVAPGAALAQAYYHPHYGGYGGYGAYDGRADGWGGGPPPQARGGAPYASRRAIAELLAEQGYRLLGRLDFQGEDIVATGIDADGRTLRFVIDPYDGAILDAHRMTRQSARPEMGPDEIWPDGPRQRPARRPRDDGPPPAARYDPAPAPYGRAAPEPEPSWERAEPRTPQRPVARPAAEPPEPRSAHLRDETPPPAAAKHPPQRSAAVPAREEPRPPTGSSHRAIVPPQGAPKPAAPPAAASNPPPPAASAPPVVGSSAPAQVPPPPPPVKWVDPGAAKPAGG